MASSAKAGGPQAAQKAQARRGVTVMLAATFFGQRGFQGMKTLLKILLIALAVIVAFKLLPVLLALACAAVLVAGLAVALGAGLVAIMLGVGLALSLVLSPVWVPGLALIGGIVLIRKICGRSAVRT